MTRYFNNAPAHFARMGGQRGAIAVAVAATRSTAPALSYLAPLRVPPPHPALFIAAGLAIAFTLWRQSQTEEVPEVPGTSSFNPVINRAVCSVVAGAYDLNKYYYANFYHSSVSPFCNSTPDGILGYDRSADFPQQTTGNPVIPAGYRALSYQYRNNAGQTQRFNHRWFYNPTADPQPILIEEPGTPAIPAQPGRTVPLPTLPQTWASPYPTAPSRPIQVTTLPPATVAVPVRGFGVNVQTGAAVAPMWPVKEMKAAASAATMRVISQTFGQMGEAVDFTRCLMGAIGNTYSARTVDYYSTTGHRVSAPVERAIPKWQWGMALETLAQGGEGAWIKPKNYRDYVRFKDGVFVHPSGRSVTAAEAAERFAKCLILEWWTDRVAAEQSKILRDIGRKFGLMAGPFGVETLWTLAQGGVPYEGLFNLGLTPSP